ncbi:MAG: hypothetical protein R2831_00030 [Chitinophagaceae bacterium]
MQLIPIELIQYDTNKLKKIYQLTQDVHRLVLYSKAHIDDDVLEVYYNKLETLQELVSIKNAQMEAQSEEDVVTYQKKLKKNNELYY